MKDTMSAYASLCFHADSSAGEVMAFTGVWKEGAEEGEEEVGGGRMSGR